MEQTKKSELDQLCPQCSSASLVEDVETGDILCSNCGYVLAERVPSEYERRYPRMEGVSPERVGPPLSLAEPDLGLGTAMVSRRGAGRIRLVEVRGYYTRRQRTLARALRLIRNMAEKLSLSRVMTERAAYLYRIAVREDLLVGRPAKLLAAAAVYASCREAGIPRSITLVAETAGLGRRELAREYRKIANVLNLTMVVVQPERYVSRIADLLALDERIRREAYSILARAERNGFVAGKDPKGLAAAALHLAAQSVPKRPSRTSFAMAAGVTTVTLRKRIRQLQKYLRPI